MGASGKASYSSDGITWTSLIAGVDTGIKFDTTLAYSVAYGAGKFVAVGDSGKASYSSDGITWTALTPGTNTGIKFGTTVAARSIVYGDDKFVVVGLAGKASYSADGITWTSLTPGVDTGIKFGTNSADAYSIAYGGGKFVVVGFAGKASYSTDGITWISLTPGVDTGIKFTSTAFSITYGGDKFVVVGNSGKASYSTDGITWTSLTPGIDTGIKFNTDAAYSIAYGANKFVVVGLAGKASYSADGITWTSLTPGTDTGIKFSTIDARSIIYGGDKFVVVGSSGKASYSSDGITWTSLPPGFDTGIKFSVIPAYSVAYGADKFVVVGDIGMASYSVDPPTTHTIIASSAANGTISPSGSTTVDDGSNQTFIITPSANYHVLDLLVDDVSVGTSTTYTFSNVTTDHTIGVTFAIDTKTVTFNKNTGDTEANPTTRTVNYNATTTLPTPPTKSGHSFTGWNTLENGSGTSFTTSTFVTDNITIYAQWLVSSHTITASAGTNGSISPSGEVGIVDGADQTFTITPSANYHVLDVLVDGVSVGATTTHTFSNVTADHTIGATFAIDTKTLTYTAGSNGSITGNSTQTVNYGSNGTEVIAVPNTGYHFLNWSDNSTINPRTDINVIDNLSLTANFEIDAVVVSPISSGSSVFRRIKNLINQGKTQEANQLQKQFPNVTTPPIIQSEEQTTSNVPSFSNSTFKPRDLTINSEGNDVKTLQTILNLMGYTISPEGPGSIGKETTMFGSFTKQALIKFQKENNITPAEGYFGSKTRDTLIIKLIKLLVS